jgi:hypothetical protein
MSILKDFSRSFQVSILLLLFFNSFSTFVSSYDVWVTLHFSIFLGRIYFWLEFFGGGKATPSTQISRLLADIISYVNIYI